jgi:uncharacterized membrane protein YphA (DoxX/SURF4 family)
LGPVLTLALHDDEAGTKAEGMGLFLKKPFHFWIRLLLGGVFLVASLDKIYNPAGFAQAVYNHQILPDGLVNLVAIVLPWLELLLGLCLLGGVWLPGAVTLTSGLLMIFLGALVFNMSRGLDVHCGCFGTGSAGPITIWTLARDASFLVMAGYLFCRLVARGEDKPVTGPL